MTCSSSSLKLVTWYFLSSFQWPCICINGGYFFTLDHSIVPFITLFFSLDIFFLPLLLFFPPSSDIPEVKIELGAKIDPASVREGTDVYFECIINANPWVTEVSWYFEGKGLFSDPSSGVIISNQSLVLQRVKKSMRGKYWCTARNRVGLGRSSDFFLRVLCK